MTDGVSLEQACWLVESVRYADTDRQRHVNNAVFSTFLEIGRVALLYEGGASIASAETDFVIVRAEIDYRAEIAWPGTVAIGTSVEAIGNSSVKLRQVLVNKGGVAASASSTIVLVDRHSRRATPLPAAARDRLEACRMLPTVPPPCMTLQDQAVAG